MLCSRFNSSSHVYFVTVQKKSYLPGEAEAGYVTRISRTCVTDANFDTYSEVTLECRLGGDNYNLVQDAVTLPASKKVIFQDWCRDHRTANDPSVNHIEGPYSTKAFSWLKAHTSILTFKTLSRHYAKPMVVGVKLELGRRRKGHKGCGLLNIES